MNELLAPTNNIAKDANRSLFPADFRYDFFVLADTKAPLNAAMLALIVFKLNYKLYMIL